MPGPFPLPATSLIPQITATGINSPSYSDILFSHQASAQIIFGSDVSIDPDDQDQQLLAIFCLALHVANDAIVGVYNSFSPATAIGAGLSSIVKINGIRRQNPSNSSAPVILIGQAGITIIAGILTDANNNQWALPTPLVFPSSGEIDTTATCVTPGAIAAAANTIGNPSGGGKILNLQPGWQTATNPTPATIGAPVENDAALRQRQTISTGLPAQTTLDGLRGNVANTIGVSRSKIYQNDGAVPDRNGIPSHSIAVVVAGGDANAIAAVIAVKKGLGTGTYGTTQVVLYDQAGLPVSINFFYLTTVQIYVTVTIQALQGYTVAIGNLITSAVAQAINSLDIGAENTFVYLERLESPVSLQGDAATISSALPQSALDQLGKTYIKRGISIGFSANPTGNQDLNITFYQAAICSVANVNLVVQ